MTAVILPEVPIVADLPPPLQPIATGYIEARDQGGEALLHAAALLAEARLRARYGEWAAFLQATDTSPDIAERLLAIHRRALQDAAFADAVAHRWLTFSVAALLARPSTPPEVVTQFVNAPEPPQVREVQAAINEAKREAKPDANERRAYLLEAMVFPNSDPKPLPRPTTFMSTPEAIRDGYLAGAIEWGEAWELLRRQRQTVLLMLEDVDRIERWLRRQDETSVR